MVTTAEHSIFTLDLATRFSVEDLLSTDSYRNIPIPLDLVPNIKEQAEAHMSGALFATNDSFYIYGSGASPLFGGVDPGEPTAHTLASYNASTEKWGSVSPSGGSFNSDARLLGQATSDPMTGTSYFTGGANNVQGVLEFDASDYDHISWTNHTRSTGLSGTSPGVIAGGMVFLPFGKAGILLLLGGANVCVHGILMGISSDGQQPITFARQDFSGNWMHKNEWDMLSMDVVHVYDIDSSTWSVSPYFERPHMGIESFC